MSPLQPKRNQDPGNQSLLPSRKSKIQMTMSLSQKRNLEKLSNVLNPLLIPMMNPSSLNLRNLKSRKNQQPPYPRNPTASNQRRQLLNPNDPNPSGRKKTPKPTRKTTNINGGKQDRMTDQSSGLPWNTTESCFRLHMNHYRRMSR